MRRGESLSNYCRRFKIPMNYEEKWYMFEKLPNYKISNYGRLMDDNKVIIKAKFDDTVWYDVTVDLIKYRIEIVYDMIIWKYPLYRKYYIKNIKYKDGNRFNVSMDNIKVDFSKYSIISDKWKPIPNMNGYFVNNIGEVVKFGNKILTDTVMENNNIILHVGTHKVNITETIKLLF